MSIHDEEPTISPRGSFGQDIAADIRSQTSVRPPTPRKQAFRHGHPTRMSMTKLWSERFVLVSCHSHEHQLLYVESLHCKQGILLDGAPVNGLGKDSRRPSATVVTVLSSLETVGIQIYKNEEEKARLDMNYWQETTKLRVEQLSSEDDMDSHSRSSQEHFQTESRQSSEQSESRSFSTWAWRKWAPRKFT